MRRSTIRMKVDQPTSSIIKAIIDKHAASKTATFDLYKRYDQKDVPIQSRTMSDNKKPNNKLTHDYRGYIIDQIVGYLWGKPISYQIDKLAYDESNYDKCIKQLSRFSILNSMDDLDSELGKRMSICGYAARLLYIDKDGLERVMNLNPWEVVFIQEGNERTHAVRYYKVKAGADKKEERTRIEWYDNKQVTFYVEDDKGEYVLDQEEAKDHLYGYVPVILFQNNDEEKGDFEKVEPLIDAYDKNRSDSVNELETFASAYMGFTGVDVDDEVIAKMKQTGALNLGEDGDAFFITKDINDSFVENTRKNLDRDIHKFSASVDMADEKFSGSSQTGESRKWKLISLENKAATKSRKFSKGLREQFKVLCSAWKKKNVPLDYLDMHWDFKRNLPIDLSYIAEYASKLKGIQSDRTTLSQIPYIDDVDYELQLMKEESEGVLDLDKVK
ncbi:phage portal protein [Priestia megaterium]|uniref:phage portal protein n=1 Tax=Priestia megaterium TaxID=1404 RepID=UPI0011707FD6